jgi:hypothetical protein
MRAGRAEAGEIDGFAPRQLVTHMRDPRLGEFRTQLMKAGGAQGFRCQPAREAESTRCEFWMPRPNSCVRFQSCATSGPAITPAMAPGCINHNWRSATTAMHGRCSATLSPARWDIVGREAPQRGASLRPSLIPEYPAPRATRAGRATVASRDSRLRPESLSAGLSVRC